MPSNRFRTRWIIALVLGAGFILSAFSDNHSQETSAAGSTSAAPEQASPSRASDGGIDPCALMTGAEAAEALGVSNVKMERPDEVNIPFQLETCLYSGDGAVVLVMVSHGQSPEESTIGFEERRKNYAETLGVVDVPDIGEQAYWIEDLRQLLVLKGILQLAVSGNISLEKAKELAGKAVERLE